MKICCVTSQPNLPFTSCLWVRCSGPRRRAVRWGWGNAPSLALGALLKIIVCSPVKLVESSTLCAMHVHTTASVGKLWWTKGPNASTAIAVQVSIPNTSQQQRSYLGALFSRGVVSEVHLSAAGAVCAEVPQLPACADLHTDSLLVSPLPTGVLL
jgi:hypothetical protein